MRTASIHFVVQQRSLDRCVMRSLKARCEALNRLSVSNRALRRIATALAIIEAAKTAGAVIPGVGQAMAVVGEASLTVARSTARAIAGYQNGQIAFEKVSALSVLRCGVPLSGVTPMAFSRPRSIEAVIAGVPAPLHWDGQPASTEIDILGWTLQARSFGYCAVEKAPRSGESEASGALRGENYELRFRHPQRQTARQRLRRLFSLP